jgi:hypothetical protein
VNEFCRGLGLREGLWDGRVHLAPVYHG